MSAPYHGLKVLDLSQGIAGPYCAMILQQNGAEVIKVEPPTGDWSRGIGHAPEGMSALAISYNLGKQSICIDGRSEQGLALMRTLALQADIVIESFRPGVMAKLGLSYAALSKEKPGLVYVSVSAFGPDGPYAERPGSDSTLQAMSGMMVVNRDSHGTPRKVGILLIDVATGIYAAQATGTALYRRATQGTGTHVEISLLECAAAVQGGAIVDETLGGGRVAQPLSVPAGTFATQDGHVNVTSLHDRMFVGLCKALGKDEWIADARFASAAERFSHAAEINGALEAIFPGQPTAYWLDALSKHGVVCGKVAGYADFLADPQVMQQAIFQQSDQGGLGHVPMPRIPGVAHGATARSSPSPRKGEHTCRVLAELGLDETEIQALLASGVVLSRDPAAA
ncbi:CoA transferase [Imbroritus primus]|uniref:CaiB/BaiF CoA transferase family protein n=1 Tax=Imbroritus primus TaxID=3058603 RepID=UPI00026973D2